MRPRPHPLWALAAAFTLLVLAHGAATPVFEAPDEVWHYAYVRWIAEGHGLPPLTDDRSGAHQQVAQPPLAYLVAALVSRPFDDADLEAVRWHNPGFGYQAPGTVPDNKNMLIHPPDQRWPWTGAVLAIHATRLASLGFGLVTVLAAWALGMETFGNRRLALVTAALVAFQPQFVFISSVVSNDAAAAALATTALWLAVRILRRGVGWRHTTAAGVVGGLALLTKTSVLPAVPLVGGAILWAALRVPASGLRSPTTRLRSLTTRLRSPASSATRARRAAAHVALFTALTAATGGWWLVRNVRQTGTLLGLVHHIDTLWGRPEPVSLLALLPELPLLLRSFWGAYGWGHVAWPAWVYIGLWALSLPLLLLAIATLVRTWLRAATHRQARDLLAGDTPESAVALAGAVALAWLTGITAALLWWMRTVEAPHGRLLFPALGAWALLLTLGLHVLSRVKSARRWHRLAPAVLLGTCAVLATLAPGSRILASFAPPRLQTSERIRDACTRPQDLIYGDRARLLCAAATPERVAPGESVEVWVCWEALAPLTTDYTAFVHLIGPEHARAAERHTYPGLGRAPTSLWVPGTAFCDTLTLQVAAWAETPIRYHLEVGLFDAETGERPAARNAAGDAYEPPIVGAVTVVPGESTKAPSPDTSASASVGGAISLTAYDAPTTARPGAPVTVTLTWRATAAPSQDYVTFVHLWQPGDPAPLAQHDGQPRDGWYPTSAWQPGDVVSDSHVLQLPEDLTPGSYPLWAGIYNPEDGTRLSAAGPEGRFDHDLVPLGLLDVRP